MVALLRLLRRWPAFRRAEAAEDRRHEDALQAASDIRCTVREFDAVLAGQAPGRSK